MAKRSEKEIIEEHKETELFTLFGNYQSWLDNQGIPERTKKNINFCEGNQWPDPTERTEDMPRPTYNFYSYLLDTKAGNILGSPMKTNYVSNSNKQVSNKFTRVSDFVRHEAHEEDFDYKAVRKALLEGTAFKYYYFDENAIGMKGEYKGGVRIESIDIDDVAFADPTDDDIQKQKWIIIRNRVDIDTVKKMCEDKKLVDLIEPDEVDNSIFTNVKELKGSKMAYVYTQMSRIDGEVQFRKATKNVLLHDYKPANPKLVEEKYYKKIKEINDKDKNEDLTPEEIKNQATDPKISVDHDSDLEHAKEYTGYKFYLYPINSLTFKEHNKSIIGIPEFNDIIEAQKTINSNQGVATLNNLQMACPKWIVKENALQGQVISNRVGETIVDHTPAGQKGIDILQGQPITTGAYQLAPVTMEMLKTIKGASDVITGETSSKDLSGYAIAQLAAQSQKPIALLQKELWRHKEREAEIFRQFIILFYNDDIDYKYPTTIEEQAKQIQDNLPVSEYNVDTFNGDEFANFEFEVKIEVGAGTQYSEIQSMSLLDTLLQMKLIDLATYVEVYPDKAMPFKQQLKELLRLKEASENTQLKQQLQAMQQEKQQLAEYSNSLESQNKELSSMAKQSQNLVKQLTREYTDKINLANKALLEKNGKNTQTDSQTTE